MHKRENNNHQPSAWEKYSFLLGMALFAYLLLHIAWLSDSALITYKTIVQSHHSGVIGINGIDRVMTFSHPLWYGLLHIMHAIQLNLYHATWTLSLLLTITALTILFYPNKKKSYYPWVVPLIVLACAKSFTEYAISGLEYPLSYLLMAIFLYYILDSDPFKQTKKQLTTLFLINSLLALTYFTGILIILPYLITRFLYFSKKDYFLSLFLGSLPLLAWVVFATIYFGSPFSASFYAGLNGVYSPHEHFLGGFYNIKLLFLNDLPSFLLVTAALIIGIINNRVNHALIALGLLAYIISSFFNGGSDTLGQYFALPSLVGAALLYDLLLKPKHLHGIYLAIIIGYAFIAPNIIRLPSLFYSQTASIHLATLPHGIYDKWHYQATHTAWLRYPQLNLPALRYTPPPTFNFSSPDENISIPPEQCLITCSRYGYHVNNHNHSDNNTNLIIDACGRTDPFLAHLPAVYSSNEHARDRRYITNDYLLAQYDPQYVFNDIQLQRYHHDMRLITRGDLWDKQRLQAIMRLHLPGNPYQIHTTDWQTPTLPQPILCTGRLQESAFAYW